MTKEDTQHVLEKAKATRFDEYGNYGENNGPIRETTFDVGTNPCSDVSVTDAATLKEYSGFVEGMILTFGRDRLAENALGLAGEAGEVAEKVKKFFRDNTLDKEAIQKELGDTIFYWVAMHGALDLDPQETIVMNMEKLSARKERGTLQGNGDNR